MRAWASAGFTFAEVLAAMLFVAVLLPVSLQGIRLAARAGAVAERRALAGQLADRWLSEVVLTESWRSGATSGTFDPDWPGYAWRLTDVAWPADALRLVTVQVGFTVQGQEQIVSVSTLVDEAAE